MIQSGPNESIKGGPNQVVKRRGGPVLADEQRLAEMKAWSLEKKLD
jgi:hypothetical protein